MDATDPQRHLSRPTSDPELAAAWLLAFSGLSTHIAVSANLEALADSICPTRSRGEEFGRLVRDVQTDVRHVFADRATVADERAREKPA
jgi:hypothetical protein